MLILMNLVRMQEINSLCLLCILKAEFIGKQYKVKHKYWFDLAKTSENFNILLEFAFVSKIA